MQRLGTTTMTGEEQQRWDLELAKLRIQTGRALEHAEASFWPIGIACFVAGAALGGTIVQLLHLIARSS